MEHVDNKAVESHFGHYIQERLGKHIIENRYGFVTYMIEADYIYIEDVYVDKGYRRSSKGTNLLDEVAEIALKNGIKKLLTTVAPTALGSTDSIKAVLGYGFELLNSDQNVIYFTKKIGE